MCYTTLFRVKLCACHHMPNNQGNPRVALVGHRGIPNGYGGFETLAEELAKCLVGLGCAAVVYCRKQYFKERPATYQGAKLVYLSTITNKFLDTFYHTFISVLHAILKNTADVIIVVNVGNAPFALLAKLFGKKVIFCVDGLDWQRKKWNAFARWYLKTCSYLAKFVAHEVVTDAQSVQEFYKNRRATRSTHIPYGTDIEIETTPDVNVLAEYGLEYKKYFTYVARFEPENNPLLVVKAYVESGSTLPLVMIGDNRYSPEFVKTIKAAANDKVLFLGYVFGAKYKQLVKNSLCYIRAAEVGGLSPAVIEAMGRGVCVIANDKLENREPLGDTGLFYKLAVQDLSVRFREVSAAPEKAITLGKKAAERAMIVYNWDAIGYEYFKLVKKVTAPAHRSLKKQAVLQGVKKKRVLITGAGGMLGQAMYEHFSKTCTVRASSVRPQENWLTTLDVRDFEAYQKEVAAFQPDYIFHLAAQTNLEQCEKSLSEAYAVNTLPVKYAAQLATSYGAKLVYISSAGVFDGSQASYGDTDEPCPATVYGLTKHMGALMTEYYARDYLILRLGWLVGGGPLKDKKFVAKIIEQIIAGKKELHALTDKIGSLSYTHDVAKNLDLLLQHSAQGSYNMGNAGFATRCDVAKAVVKILGYEGQIKVIPVDSSFFSHTFTAPRSNSECLVNERLDREKLNSMRSWEIALEEYLHRDFAYAFNATQSIGSVVQQPAI